MLKMKWMSLILLDLALAGLESHDLGRTEKVLILIKIPSLDEFMIYSRFKILVSSWFLIKIQKS